MSRQNILTTMAFATGIMLLHVVLVMPSHPAGLSVARLVRPTWDLPVLLLALSIFRGASLRLLVVGIALALVLFRAANLGTYAAFSRPFNPLLDGHLIGSGWDLLSGTVGRDEAIALAAVTLMATVALGWVLWKALSRIATAPLAWQRGISVVPLTCSIAAAALPGWAPLAAAPNVAGQVARMTNGVADLAAFTARLSEAPDEAPTFAALEGRDVIVAFVESYGRSFLEDEQYRSVSADRLAEVEARLGAAGWSVRSAWVAAPTRGGQSWLSHATLLSGLHVDGQIRYDRLIASEHPSLNALFSRAGWRTGAAMPAITQPWPEAAWYGYDVVLDADRLGYKGDAFEWVTMPDQYTWSAMDRKLRGGAPAMIELALITSHAPWTPLPEVLPWDLIGDGVIFDGTHRTGEPPRVVWSNPETIRRQYALSLDYALEVMGQYVARYGRGALFIIVGDHQPAPLLTGEQASPDVPIHVISDDPGLLERLPEEFFGSGLYPDPSRPALPMKDVRAILTTIYENPQAGL